MKTTRSSLPGTLVATALAVLATTGGASAATSASASSPSRGLLTPALRPSPTVPLARDGGTVQLAQDGGTVPRELQPKYEPVPPEPKSSYNSSYVFGLSKGLADSTISPAGKAPLFLLTVPVDLVLLPFTIIGGFFG